MILIEPCLNDPATFSDAVTLASQLDALGHSVFIREERFPEGVRPGLKYEALRFLRSVGPQAVSAVLATGADLADDSGLQDLRRLNLHRSAPVVVFGRFSDRQAELTAAARFAYVTGHAPVCINLSQHPELGAEDQSCPCFGVNLIHENKPFLPGPTPVLVYLSEPEAGLRRAWTSMLHSRDITPVVWMPTRDKAEWLQSGAIGKQSYTLSEMPPAEMARFASVLVVASDIGHESRALCLVNNMAASGGVVIDCTESGKLSGLGLPVLRGPGDPGFLHAFLKERVLPNIDGLRAEVAASDYSNKVDLAHFLESQGIVSPKATSRISKAARRSSGKEILFMPTNGVGLGHARRCSLIGTEIRALGATSRFAAFPSCGPMLEACGFNWSPLVPKSSLHESEGTNDILNASRLLRASADSDVFVFDGGFVFDSVQRTIVRRNLPAVWIRRGLWPAIHDNSLTLDRSKLFARIVVPGEAFPELNHTYSSGQNHFSIGPIVQRIVADKKAVRRRVARKLGLDFDKLIVTMPGGGVAMDMSAQVHSICATTENRDDVLNLIVVWPGATLPVGWNCWRRSRVVTTTHAAVLASASDFAISASGYNAFHEALYNKTPAIFVPQIASFLDDQSARAAAAASRGLASHIEAGRLGALEREITRFLDQGKAETIRERLAALELPEPGNRVAARLILELAQ